MGIKYLSITEVRPKSWIFKNIFGSVFIASHAVSHDTSGWFVSYFYLFIYFGEGIYLRNKNEKRWVIV